MENRFRFRVWDKENKNFLVKKKVNKAYDVDGNRLPVIIYSAPDFYSENTLEYCMECDGFIVMQSTGLSDKNGKLIFEGDLLKIKDNIYNIIWDMDCLQYFLEKDGFKFCWSDCFDEEKRKFIVEVIGNIYENKELIGE